MTRSGITLLVAAFLLYLPVARGAPLDKDGCANLKAEQGQLEQAGTRGNMAKGPLWAKTNLEPSKLEQIRRLLEVDEQLLFRCQGKPLVDLPKDPTDPDPAAREPGTEPAKAAKAPKKEVAKKDPGKKEAVMKKAAAPPANPATKTEAGPAPAEKKPPAAKKAKAKQKVDDAYRPPVEPGSNPFPNQQPQPKQ